LLVSKVSANDVLAALRRFGKRSAGGAVAHLAKRRSDVGLFLEYRVSPEASLMPRPNSTSEFPCHSESA
jgi:hypothetical protein